MKIPFTQIHRFAMSPRTNLDIVKDIEQTDIGVLKVTFKDNKEITFSLCQVEIEELLKDWSAK